MSNTNNAGATRAIFLTALLVAAASLPARALTLDCGRLLDVKTGHWQERVAVTVEQGRIMSVSGQDGAAGHVDLQAFSCLPGLIDAHTHITHEHSAASYSEQFRLNLADYAIRSTVYAQRTLEAGFTTVRNVGDEDGDSIALRNQINAGLVPGPRIYTAGVAIGTTGGHADPTDGYREDLAGDPGPMQGVINGPQDAVKAVRQHYKVGADLIKIMPSGGVLDESLAADNQQMTEAEIAAIVATAHDYGFAVAAHAHSAESIRRAVSAGVDSIEHGTYLDAVDMQLMKQHGTWLVPTLVAGRFVTDKARVEGYFPPQVAAKALQIGPRMQEMLGKAYRAGVKIAFGTDSGVSPHGENAREFTLMVAAGMPPLEAIRAATINAAELLRHPDLLGQVQPGYAADLIAVRGDPLQDVSVLQHVEFVMKQGVVYKSPGMP